MLFAKSVVGSVPSAAAEEYSGEVPRIHREHLVAQASGMHGKLAKDRFSSPPYWSFANSLRFWSEDTVFWEELVCLAIEHPIRPAAVGAASAVVRKIFGIEIPKPLQEWAQFAPDTHIQPCLKQFGNRDEMGMADDEHF